MDSHDRVFACARQFPKVKNRIAAAFLRLHTECAFSQVRIVLDRRFPLVKSWTDVPLVNRLPKVKSVTRLPLGLDVPKVKCTPYAYILTFGKRDHPLIKITPPHFQQPRKE